MPAVLERPPIRTTPALARTRVESRPMPQPGETQLQFVDRCMRSVTGTTDRKNAVALASWSDSGRESELERIAREKFPPSKYRRFRNRCVFAEHSRKRMVTDPHTGQQREEVEIYDRNALAAIVDRCNERILDTADFAPITEGHTPDEEARIKGQPMPPVLGYDGPFRLGVIGNRKPRYAIFCDEFVPHANVERMSALPRRSPEVWVEERMEDRFFDPVAALGAETPRLDMGMSLYAMRDGRRVEKYCAAMPSGSNTFLPSDTGERRRESKNQAGESSMLSPEDVKQIVDAIMQTNQMQWVTEQMGGANAPAGGGDVPPDGAAPGPDDAGAPPPAPALDAGGAPADDTDKNMAGSPSAMWAQVDENEDGRRQNGKGYAKGRMKGNWHQSYECDDDDKSMIGRYMSGEMGDDEAGDYLKQKRQQYMASASVAVPDPGNPTGTATVGTPPATDNYARGDGDYKVRYHRLEKENRELRERVGAIERTERETYRKNKLLEKAGQGYVFDIEDELKLTADYTPQQFDRHVSGVIEKYERCPIGHPGLPTPHVETSVTQRAADKRDKDRADKITRYRLREREKGNEISWEEAAEHIDQSAA